MWQAALAFGVALIGFLGVVLGAVVTGFVTLRQAELATQREREARQALREQERQDRRDNFQRETLLALQDVLSELHTAVGREQDRMLTAEAEQGAWPVKPVELPLPEDFMKAHREITKLRARVFDQELRDLMRDIRDGSTQILIAHDRETSMLHVRRVDKLVGRLHDRVIVLFAELF
jgi:hypothetical protein